MSIYENDIIILLRKIVAISIPDSFEATEDTNRIILLDKLKFESQKLFKVVDDFILAFESREFIRSDYQLKLKAHDIWQMQYDMFNKTLEDRQSSLLHVCKEEHIDISYELSKILDDGDFSK